MELRVRSELIALSVLPEASIFCLALNLSRICILRAWLNLHLI